MTAKLHRVHIPNVGEALISYEGGTPYQADDVQKYPLGTLLRLGGRTFAYAKASGTQIPDVGSQIGSVQHVANVSVQANYAAGVKAITITTTDTDGAGGDGAIAADELVGGYVVVFPAASNHAFVRQITSNTYVIASGTHVHTMTIGLDSPTPIAITTSDKAECMASPYLNVITASSEARSIVGVPTVAATTGQFFWLQTWGPCWIATSAECGAGSNDRNVVFRYNGSGDECAYAGTYNSAKAQQAGHILTNGAGTGQGAPFIMLQITP